MKPFIWMNKDHRADFDGAKGDLGLTVPVWNDSLNQYAKSKGLKPMDVPLYTSEQLAEAVAAEREKNAKGCDEAAKTAGSVYSSTAYDPENRGADCAEEIARDCAEAIRSAAK
ncbi:hypothetical protein [Gluconobacter oxydans]|uniref:hypothetical protein n=1 Tax=Gluconobacter oxydans TaxID=442 RepID=UPI0039E9A692